MLPLFVVMTTYTGREPVVINVNHIMYIKPMKEYGGSTVYLTDGSKVTVKDSPEQILWQILDRGNVLYTDNEEPPKERTIEEDDD